MSLPCRRDCCDCALNYVKFRFVEKKRIYLSPPCMAGREFALLKRAFDSNWIAPAGPDLGAFEQALAEYTGSQNVAVLSSGSAAIHLALMLLGVGPGDEVAVSSFTFAASANPVVYQGALPVFIDSETDTWNIDPQLFEEAIQERQRAGRKLKAVVAVHLYGMPCRIKEISDLCSRYEIALIEDAAEALGSAFEGRRAGTFGRMGILSFNGNKIITTSGGGALISDDADLIARARHLATQARDPAPYYQHSAIGYNYRMSNLAAAVGCGQLEQLDTFIKRRREIAVRYQQRLGKLPGVSFLKEPSREYFSNFWLSTMLLDPVQTGNVGWAEVMAALEQQNIESRPLWKPLHLQPVFKNCPAFVNGTAEGLFARGLCLPSGSQLSEAEQDQICEVVETVLSR
ncbi:MAG: aminotransferase class I/II-fold pyridoxal phosphate-dependent enzyme [Deltaproteobacteria bacterium]|nr:aminotransferase class I/II-fold pyridoxal phosphate-dependent enzyme [Deltaproteobacteria bacterium]